MSKSVFFFLLALVFFGFRQTSSKVFTRCELTQELLRSKIYRSLIGNWLCMIENESGRDTTKVTSRPNKSRGLGLFQISSNKWCTNQRKGGICNMRCEDLLNENISDDLSCAKNFFNYNGFKEWEGWTRNCKGKNLPFPNC